MTAASAEIFPTGEEKFGRLKADLAAATRFIHVQYFIWEDDELTDALTAILKERAQAGVQVRVLYDYLGSKHWDKSKLEALVPLGAKVARDVISLSHLNYRDHRKIVVIDGEIGYTGGYNVGQEYVDGGKRFARWRDTHVRVTGQVVGELQALFATRWFDQTKEDVLTEEYLPAPPVGDGADGVLCQVVAQAVEDPWNSSRRAHMLAVGNAGRRVWIQSPYFVPEVGLYDTMINAALSGVDVRFMMTGVPDKKVPFWAAWTYFRRLLKAGVHVYLYEAGFLHAKTIVIDSAHHRGRHHEHGHPQPAAPQGAHAVDVRRRARAPAGGALRAGHPGLARSDLRRSRPAQAGHALQELVHAPAVVLHLRCGEDLHMLMALGCAGVFFLSGSDPHLGCGRLRRRRPGHGRRCVDTQLPQSDSEPVRLLTRPSWSAGAQPRSAAALPVAP